MKLWFVVIVLLLEVSFLRAQTDVLSKSNDSIPVLPEAVIISGFEQNKRANSSAINISFLSQNTIDRSNKSSLVNGLNSVSGVRMEERSPGSYRISLRGSSLRSPFGVRNVKVYWNGIPVTDPGGNTYFNQFTINNFSSIEIFKGPAGSLYGAGTGGLILMNSITNDWQTGINAEYITGSFGLNNFLLSAGFGKTQNRNSISYFHSQSSGYRDNTRMQRDNFSWVSEIKNSDKQTLTASLLFSNLYYQTPGALILKEFQSNPKAARPAIGNLPSARDAKTAIYQRNVLAGLTNLQGISRKMRNTTSLYGAFAHIENPTVRNYEIRREPHFGGRSSLQWKDSLSDKTTLQFVIGSEAQLGFFNTRVAGNIDGKPDTLQTDDDIRYSNYSVFVQTDFDFNNKIFIVGGISVNRINVQFQRLNELPLKTIENTYRNEFAPMVSAMGKITKSLLLGASISKGFSPPTVSELLPSTSFISTNLEAETGTNYELSVKKNLLRNALQLEVNAYMFRLKNALVQRRDFSGADYYVNSGSTNQKGIEFSTFYSKFFNSNTILKRFVFRTAYTYSNFKYFNFTKDTFDFSGKFLPSVPNHIVSSLADVSFKNNFYLNLTQYFASEIYLNNANTAKADAYSLLGMRLGWKPEFKYTSINIYAGADNLLNEKYSLGNDINDPRQRYYNAAPERNYYFGVAVKI